MRYGSGFTFTLILISLLLGIAGEARADWRQDLAACLAAEDSAEVARLATRVLAAEPGWQALSKALAGVSFPSPAARGEARLDSVLCRDGQRRPFVTYVPGSYDPERTTALLVWLHGGVSRLELFDDALGYARESAILPLAEQRGCLLLFPFGQAGATWWDEVGMANVLDLIRLSKRHYNVDDDRVWLAGFSDGASGAFGFAMLTCSDFAACVPLNGHIGVANLAGDQDTYAPNLAAMPLYVINTDEDGLYPSAKMRPMIDLARTAGADLHYREYHGFGHDPSYLEMELSRLGDWLERHPRDPFPQRLYWETSKAAFSLCRWFRIDAVLAEPPAPWHRNYNLEVVDERISIGFIPDDTHTGKGVRVGRLSDGDTLARRIGLRAEDIIVGGDGNPIDDMGALAAWKYGLSRGQAVTMTVQRGEERLELAGKIPATELHFLFKRERPSAAARVDQRGNTVRVQGSRLGAFTILVHPDHFQLDQELVVEVDGKTVFQKRVEPDPAFLLHSFLAERDRRRLYLAALSIDLRE